MKNIKEILEEIKKLAKKIKREVVLMEVCGTHTQQIVRFGIRKILPKNIKLVPGPGCPVCITPQEDIDAICFLALNGIPVASYGDVLRVPGYFGSLEKIRQKTGKVFEVYCVDEALSLKKKFKDLVFFGVGFETTAPMTAWAIKKGLTVFSAHRLFLPILYELLKDKNIKIDGLIAPGHVSTIVGEEPYKKVNLPCVISGFELDDIIVSIFLLLKQIKEKQKKLENQYVRSVKKKGNEKAKKLMFEVFEPKDGNCRGFGKILKVLLEIKKKYSKFDAKVKYSSILKRMKTRNKKSKCLCDKVLKGIIQPKDCPLFKKVCTIENPIGPCMVSQEGACNVELKYGEGAI